MHNQDLIRTFCMMNKIFTEEQIKEYKEKEQLLPMFTKEEWIKKGYKIKPEYEKKPYVVRLWIQNKNKHKFYFVPCNLYSDKMVDKI